MKKVLLRDICKIEKRKQIGISIKDELIGLRFIGKEIQLCC